MLQLLRARESAAPEIGRVALARVLIITQTCRLKSSRNGRLNSRAASWGYWLRLALVSNVVTKDEIAWELDEACQLRAMITQAVITAQSSSSRTPRSLRDESR